jgi:D-alanyl-D-alanine carboxypeptidase (penicillin-binding protein 5/6)
MNKWLNKKIILVITFVVCFSTTFMIGPKAEGVQLNNEVINTPDENQIDLTKNAKSAILIEPNTLGIMYQKDAHAKRPQASLTKIMTLILIYDALGKNLISLDQKLTASEHAHSFTGTQGTNIYLETGEKMSVRDLLKGLAIASANDAAVVFAEAIGGSEENFVKMMNAKAKKIGCLNTVFKNSHGLHMEGHYTSAYDLGLMASYLINNYPDVLNYTKVYEDYVRENTVKRFWLVNTNKLVKFVEGVDGLKTGWTPEAGNCMVATIKKDGVRYIAVLLGCSDNKIRAAEAMQMLNFATSNYTVIPIITKGEVIKTHEDVSIIPKVYHIIVSENVYILNRKTDPVKEVKREVNINYSNLGFDNKNAGTIKVFYNGKLVKEVGLVVKEDLLKASYFEVFFEVLKEIFLVS